MLQQTRVETVIPYYQRFLGRFPQIHTLARADLETVLKLWEGLGYYARARNLHKAAGIVCREHGGRLPEDPEQLRRLPGIGDYIAAALASIAFGRPAAVVDGNVKRVLARLFMEKAAVNDSAAKQRFMRLADEILDRHNPGQFNQAMMELGQRICTPRNPVCPVCPIQAFCRAFQEQSVADFPRRLPSKIPPLRKMVFVLIAREDRFLIIRRPNQGLLGGLWELPGQEFQGRKISPEKMAESVRGLTGLIVTTPKLLGNVRHAYTHFRVSADLYCCRYLEGRIVLAGHTAYQWIHPDESSRYAFHKLIHKMGGMVTECGITKFFINR